MTSFGLFLVSQITVIISNLTKGMEIMNKILAKEVAPHDIDFGDFFYGDAYTSALGVEYAVYIVEDERRTVVGLNMNEYRAHKRDAQAIINRYHNGENVGAFTNWAKIADIDNVNTMVGYLAAKTGKPWATKSFQGYSQGDFCTVIYCSEAYNDDSIKEIGKIWLGCGTEFCVDGCYGYFVIDEIRWEEGERLANLLADYAGCELKALEIQLYDGEHTVVDYRILDVCL